MRQAAACEHVCMHQVCQDDQQQACGYHGWACSAAGQGVQAPWHPASRAAATCPTSISARRATVGLLYAPPRRPTAAFPQEAPSPCTPRSPALLLMYACRREHHTTPHPRPRSHGIPADTCLPTVILYVQRWRAHLASICHFDEARRQVQGRSSGSRSGGGGEARRCRRRGAASPLPCGAGVQLRPTPLQQ